MARKPQQNENPREGKASDKYERVVLSYMLDHPFEALSVEQEDFFTPENQTAFKFIRSGAKDRVLLQEQMELAGFPNAVNSYNINVPDIELYIKSLVSMASSRQIVKISERYLMGELSIEDFQTETMNIRQYHKATPFSEMFPEEVIQDFDKDKELATGFPTLDRNFHLIPGEFLIVAGETSIGKSQFALNIAVNVAKQGKKVLIVSLEMKRKHILSRLVAMELQFPIKYAFATSNEYKAKVRQLMGTMDWLENILLMDDTGNSLNDVMGAIMSVKPDVAIVDYIQLMAVNGQMGEEKVMAQIAQTMQNKCRDYRLIMVSQLARKTEANDKNPLSRLKGSGALEYSASGILYIDKAHNGINTYELKKNRTGMGEGVGVAIPFSSTNGRFDEFYIETNDGPTVEGTVVEGTLSEEYALVPFN
jgi:replicative DNA helicase